MFYSITPDERDALMLSLVERFIPLIRRYASLSPRLEYEDLYQDVVVKIMQVLAVHLERIGEADIPRYVAVALRNLMIDKLRYVQMHPAVSLDVPPPEADDPDLVLADVVLGSTSDDPLMILLQSERLEELRPVVAALPQRRRAHALFENALSTAERSIIDVC
jgi:DNA-directed RNA polymerase specialized sigma24 family protein